MHPPLPPTNAGALTAAALCSSSRAPRMVGYECGRPLARPHRSPSKADSRDHCASHCAFAPTQFKEGCNILNYSLLFLIITGFKFCFWIRNDNIKSQVRYLFYWILPLDVLRSGPIINAMRGWMGEAEKLFLLFFNQMQYSSFSSVQFSCSVVSNSLRPHELQHTRPPCPSPTTGVHSDSRPSSQWCHPAISSSVVSVVPFSSCPQSLPASESFPMSQLFAWGSQSTGVSALASYLPKNTQGWSPLEWTGWNTHLYPTTIYYSELWVRQQRVKSPGSWNIRTRSEFLLYPLLDIWSWVSFFLSLCLNFPLCIMELITIPSHMLFLRD